MSRQAPAEPKRIRAFRLALARQIPRFPNDSASLQVLEAKTLGALLVDYTNWMIRFVAPRRRSIVEDPIASNDPRWQSARAEFEPFLGAVVRGDLLTPHLSQQPHTRGYTPASSAPGPGVDRWADKDMVLNVMGYHHFHSDAAPHDHLRSDDVLFARVTRDTFTVIGVFNHAAFEATEPDASMTDERTRLWQVFDEHSMRGVPASTVAVQSMITTSGHQLYLTKMSADYARIVTHQDHQLDDSAYVRGLYEGAGFPVPAKPKVRWHLHFLDLCLLDENANFFLLRNGPN